MTTIRRGTNSEIWEASARRSAAYPGQDPRYAGLLAALDNYGEHIVNADLAEGLYAWASGRAGWDREAPALIFDPPIVEPSTIELDHNLPI